MRLISIDVGIKNLAYCILESVGEDSYKIIQWDIINLCGEERKCIVCCKKAKYIQSSSEQNYCQTHAKKNNLIIPVKSNFSPAKLKKMKIEQLIELATQYKIVLPATVSGTTVNGATSAVDLLNLINDRILAPITNKSANNIDFVTIGLAVKSELDKLFLLTQLESIDSIIIENQISPIANRMKTLQGMLAQYFIMRAKPSIIFASSINKLKAFVGSEKTSYDERKKLGVEVTAGLLAIIDKEENMKKFTTHKKKDDLADSFLQGIWYLQKCGFAKINYTHSHHS
jgi:hypothetical protein